MQKVSKGLLTVRRQNVWLSPKELFIGAIRIKRIEKFNCLANVATMENVIPKSKGA